MKKIISRFLDASKATKALVAVASLSLAWAVSYFAPGVLSFAIDRQPVSVSADNIGREALDERPSEVPPTGEQSTPSPQRPTDSLDESGSSSTVGETQSQRQVRGPTVSVSSEPPYGLPHFVVPKPLAELPPMPQDVADQHDWAYAHGGADANISNIEVVIRGTTSTPTVLLGIEINVLERNPPMEGFAIAEIGGEPLPHLFAIASLDREPPRIQLISNKSPGGSEPWSFPRVISDVEPEVLIISASTESCFCVWNAELRYEYRGERESVIIDNEGEPFRTTSLTNSTLVGIE